MGTIPLGGAGEQLGEKGQLTTIPIPEELPVSPVVLIDVIEPEGDMGGGYIPIGGSKDQVLVKLSNKNYNIGWGDVPDKVPEDTTINRDGNGRISSIVTASKTIMFTRDGNGIITDITDEIYNKEILRIGDVITGIDVTLI